MRRAALIYNPAAGRWRAERCLGDLLALLGEGGFDVESLPTAGPGDATRLAREAAGRGCEVVFAFGGDGTLREVAGGLLGTDAALGPIPGGTTNVVAFSLGLPPGPLEAARALRDASPQPLDVGLCGEELFLMQASAGLDALVMSRVSPGGKRLLGKGAVAWSGLGHWMRYRYPEIDLRVDGRAATATFAAICNLPHYGGRYRMAPQASWRDRRLDLVLFHGRGRAATLAFAADLVRGRHLQRRDVRLVQVEEVEIRTPPDLALQVDGDALRRTPPVTIRLAAERLRVLLPPGSGPAARR